MTDNLQIQIIDKRIVSFLKQSTNLTLATCYENIPYCANCFYEYDEERNLLLLKSKRTTTHIQQALENKSIAGTIAPDKLNKLKIQGIQFQGNFIEPKNDLLESLKNIYYRKYPFALVIDGEIWAIEFTHIKMTDNTLGFYKNISWSIT